MKTNKVNLKVKNNQDCKYSVSIPLVIPGDMEKSVLPKYNVIVYDNGKIIETVRQENTFYFERTDSTGTHIYKVQLKNEEQIIEEQDLEIHINEEFNVDVVQEEKTEIIIDDQDFFAKIKEIINNTELKVGFRSAQWSGGSYPVIEDNNSEAVFKDLKKINKDDEVVQVMCKILSDESEEGLLIWKCITLLKHFRAYEAINYVKLTSVRIYDNRNETRFLHEECIKYLESVNSIKNRDSVINTLLYFASECFTPEARSAAITSLIKTAKRNDERIIQYLFKIIAEDSNPNTKVTAIGGLINFNISNHQQEIEELLQDASSQVRQKTSSILQNNSLRLDFSFLTKIFEEETDNAARRTLCDLLFKNYLKETKPYLLNVLEWEDEGFTNTIIDTIQYGSEVEFIVNKIEKYKDSNVYSVNLNKKIVEFLNRQKK
jgi:hypothetical protein